MNNNDVPLIPKFELSQLRQFAEKRSVYVDIPIPGNVALGIIRDETLAHLFAAMNQFEDAIRYSDMIMQGPFAEARDQLDAQAQQIAKDTLDDQANLRDFQSGGDLASLERLISQLKEARSRTFQRILAANDGLTKANSHQEALRACCVSMDDLRKSFKLLALKGVAAYLMGFLTASILTVFWLTLELVVAYVFARWIEPSVKDFVSFEATVLVLFLGQYFGMNPLLSKLKEAIYWLLYRGRLSALSDTIHDVLITTAAFRSASDRLRM